MVLYKPADLPVRQPTYSLDVSLPTNQEDPPRLCQFLMKIIPVINCVSTCVKTSVSIGGLGMCEPTDFYLIWEFLRFGLTEKALLQVILDLL